MRRFTRWSWISKIFLSNRGETGRMERKTDYINLKIRMVNGNHPSTEYKKQTDCCDAERRAGGVC